MKPKTKLQQQVVKLSGKLPVLTTHQTDWAIKKCFETEGFYRAKKIWCVECGNVFEAGVEWAQKQEQLDLKLAEYINSTELDDKLKLGEYSLVSISSMAIDINLAKTTLSTEFTHNGKRYKAEMLITQKEI